MPVTNSIQAVFLDAGGTLFEVRGSVGAVYGGVARAHGFELDVADLDAAFECAFARRGPLAFSGLDGRELRAAERAWWLAIVREVFAGRMPPQKLERYFDDLYDRFRRPEAWHLFEEVPAALESLRSAGYRLGVISNFDSRLDEVLRVLGIGAFFEAVVVSSRAGAAKPDPSIFSYALDRLGVGAARACHVGDALRDDVEGARAAGLGAVLVDRAGRYREYDGPRVESLEELPSVLQSLGPSGLYL